MRRAMLWRVLTACMDLHACLVTATPSTRTEPTKGFICHGGPLSGYYITRMSSFVLSELVKLKNKTCFFNVDSLITEFHTVSLILVM